MSIAKHLHIVSFDVPYPANYGGVIDVFYKIKHLNEIGVDVHLHCFQYGREQSKELEDLCCSVNYYQRRTSFFKQFSSWPYIVKSRISDRLVNNLKEDDYPILFEGMHTLGVGLNPDLKNRQKIYRESNIEHHYYGHLAKAENNFLKKIYFQVESYRLKKFQKNINKFDKTLVVSKSDCEYLKKQFPAKDIEYLPSFHPNNSVQIKEGKGDYALYNGNLSVAENINAVKYLINNVFNKTDYRLIVAGLNPSEELEFLINRSENIELKANLSDDEMNRLITNAHMHILITFQATGLKLKLLSTLHRGRYCIVNDKMTQGTGLSSLCSIANTANDILLEIDKLKNINFDVKAVAERENTLGKYYNNDLNALRLKTFL